MKKYIAFVIAFITLLSSSSLLAESSVGAIWKDFSLEYDSHKKRNALQIGDNIVAFQRSHGGWRKGLVVDRSYTAYELEKLKKQELAYEKQFDTATSGIYSHKSSTFDNDATHSYIRYLLRISKATNLEKYKKATIRALMYVLSAQYDTGGWPQNYPNTSSYGGNVTFNDGAMVGVLTALNEAKSKEYAFIPNELRTRIELSLLKGIEYILRTQIVQGGIHTGWAAQYDSNFNATTGRLYELTAIDTSVTSDVIRFLMKDEVPSSNVISSVISSVKWLRSVKIRNTIMEKIYSFEKLKPLITFTRESGNEKRSLRVHKGRGFDYKIVKKNGKNVRPIWARLYSITGSQPIFGDSDGNLFFHLSDIDYERRTGYRWYGYWPARVIDKEYMKWCAEHCPL